MNKILKCAFCRFHIKKPVSTNYILSYCLKFDTNAFSKLVTLNS